MTNVENGQIYYYIMMEHLLVRNAEENLHYHKNTNNLIKVLGNQFFFLINKNN